jgi:hypothetical protein
MNNFSSLKERRGRKGLIWVNASLPILELAAGGPYE